MKKMILNSVLAITMIATAPLMNSCNKDEEEGLQFPAMINPEAAKHGYMVLYTNKAIGEKMTIGIGVGSEVDKDNVWLDMNNNGVKEEREYGKSLDFEAFQEWNLKSQTIVLYGKITIFICNNRQLAYLDVSKNSQLNFLDCSFNQLKVLKIGNNANLGQVNCIGNQIEQLDVSQNNNLWKLNCYNNRLTQLNLSKNPQLKTLDCSKNQLTRLDLSKNPLLAYLECTENQLTQLNVDKNPQLIKLSCSKNQLTRLNLSKNPLLNSLECSVNRFSQSAMASILKALPQIPNGSRKGEAFLINNKENKEENYSIFTDKQKQEAKAKNWQLKVYDTAIGRNEVINP